MKKTLSFVLMLCMLISVVAPTLVFAADKTVTVNVGDVPVNFDEAKLDLLADGNTASDATSFSNAGLVGFENKGFTHTDGVDAAVEATFEIVLDLGEVQTIGSISLDAYKESIMMIALPTVDYYVSVDGINYYQINAGGKVNPAADAAENTVVTLKADFSTRIAVEAQYVKAVVSFKNGWVFLSELSVGAGNATVASEAPDAAYPYSEHMVPNPGVGVFDATDGELDLSVNDGESGRLFRNAQLIKAVYDAKLGAYEIVYSKVNPWPDGHSGTETLAEGEILVAISTLGTVTGDAFSGCKWIARGLTAGDWIVLDNGTVRFIPADGELPAAPVEPEVSDEASDETSVETSNDTSVEEPEVPAEPKVESLIPGEGANWIKTDHGNATVDTVYNEDGSVTFSGSLSGTWPCTETWYVDSPIIADVKDDELSIDFTVVGGTTNINFFFDDGNGGSYGFSISNSALNAACPGAPIDAGSGDIYDGTYTCTISIADLVASQQNLQSKAFPEGAIIDGKIRFIGINVYSVNGATITVNDLSIVHHCEDTTEEPEAPEVEGIVAGQVEVDADGNVSAIISFDELAADYHGLSAKVYFDASALTLVNSIDSDGAIACILKTPSNDWENLTKFVSDESGTYVELNFCVNAGDLVAITPDNFAVELNFVATAGVDATCIEVVEVEFIDSELNYHYGNTASFEIELPEIEVPTNLAAGKGWTGDTEIGTSYVGNLTDGKIDPDGKYDTSLWYGADKRLDDNDAFTMIFDLEQNFSITDIGIHVWPAGHSGILIPASIDFYASEDGENFELIDSVSTFEGTSPQWVNATLASAFNARYIRIDMSSAAAGDTGVFWFASEVEIYGVSATETPDVPVVPEPEIPADAEMFWVTHYNNNTVEGSGVIFTKPYDGAVWWYHVAFAPIAGVENAYEIVEISNGLNDGTGNALAIPEGGFVWASNYGNDYISLGIGDTDFTSPNCADAIARALGWAIGDQYVIYGVDFETVPTSTPDVLWYDDAYVCTAYIAPYVAAEPEEPIIPEGSVDEFIWIDGVVDENAYNSADWFNDGIWQTANGPQIADLEISYTTLADDYNIYLAIVVGGKGVEFKEALDPEHVNDSNKFSQSGATDFRIWLKGDGMETRTFYDLLWDGYDFVPFRQKVSTYEMTYAYTYGEDYIVMEIAIAKEYLAISDSYELMVTYSTPYCGEGEEVGYNAFHMTACDTMPSGWSGTTDAYETYVCEDVKMPSTAYGDVNGDGEINGKDATRLLQYLANFDYDYWTSTVDIVYGAADVNLDGVVDGRDSIRLLRYLANLTPELG